jgi:hypothetical protein
MSLVIACPPRPRRKRRLSLIIDHLPCSRDRFKGMVKVRRRLPGIHGPQGESWQRHEYRQARDLARQHLPKLFDSLGSDDIETIRWGDIAEDVAELSTLERNP